MNDIQPIKPGKLKRKYKRGSSASVVDLPAVSGTSSSHNLLGDGVVCDFPQLDEEFDDLPYSLVNMTTECVSSSSSGSCNVDSMGISSGISLKDSVSELEIEHSPLDALNSEVAVSSVKESQGGIDAKAHVLARSEASGQPMLMRISGKKKSTKASVSSDDVQTTYLSQLESFLEQARENQQKCLDTLVKLQNTNIQNERRYTLNLIIAFSILSILTVVGVLVGTNMSNDARYQELRFKNEVYTNAIDARKILESEFEREKRGSAAAFEVYQRIEQGLYEESVEKFVEVRDLLTHPAEIALLEQRIDQIQWKLAENAYHDGVMLFNASNFEQARDAFFKSMSYKENTAYTPRLSYYLAMSLFELGDFEGARRYFSQINSSDLSPEMDALARFHRAWSAEKLGDEAEAYEQFDLFLRKYRYHRLAAEATKHRAKVESGRRQ